jgi:hypothetical protein
VDRFSVNRREKTAGSNGEAAHPVAPASNGNGQAYDYAYERARRTHILANIDAIREETTKRNMVAKGEVIELFGRIASVVRSRFMRMEADLPAALEGRTASEIQKIVREKVTEALNSLSIPETFFQSETAS